MRILQVAPAYYPEIGGVERHVQAISERLAALGHAVTVATMHPPVGAPPREYRAGVEIRRFPSLGIGAAYRLPVGLRSYLLDACDDVDLIHVHNYHASLIPMVAAVHPRCMVVTPHLNDRPHSRVAAMLHRPYALIGRWSLRRASAVVCVSSAERERVMCRLGVPDARTVVIPNGVDVQRFTRGDADAVKESHLLLVVGRLQAYKRIERAIEALALLPEAYRLVVVGDGPQRSALEDYALACGVAARVRFVGAVSDEELVWWYKRAQVLVNMSEAEAFGITLVEALTAGCRIVCSAIPAFQDLARRFPNTIVTIEDSDSRVLASSIKAVRPADVDIRDLGDFTWQRVVDQLLDLYHRQADRVVKENEDSLIGIQDEFRYN